MKILITGNKGFVGRHLEKELKRLDHEVIGYDIGDTLPTKRVDLVFHLAANVNAFESVRKPFLAIENVDLMFEILEWMRQTGSNQIIYASSREIYSLVNPYGASKLMGEILLEPYCKTFGMGAISVRLANIFGKGNLQHRFIEQTISKAKKNEPIEVFGGNEKIMNFVHINECVKYLIHFIPQIEMGKNEIREVASVESYRLSLIAQIIIDMLHSKSQIIIKDNRAGETLAYEPHLTENLVSVDLRKAIKRCLK